MSIVSNILESSNLDSDIHVVVEQLRVSSNPVAASLTKTLYIMHADLKYLEDKRDEEVRRLATLAQDAVEKIAANPRHSTSSLADIGQAIENYQGQIHVLSQSFENLASTTATLLQSDPALV